jgi:hypothetical protein
LCRGVHHCWTFAGQLYGIGLRLLQ